MRTALVYNFLLEANIMASIAILLMLPIRRFLRKPLGNKALCLGWLLIAIRLLCPLALPNPIIHEIRSPFASDAAIRPIAGQIQVRITDALHSIELSGSAQGTDTLRQAVSEQAGALRDDMYSGMLAQNLMKLYLLGAALVAVWFIFCNVRLRLRLRADRIEPISGELLEQYQALCRQRGVKPIPVYFVDPLPSACLVGVVRPFIALPLTASPQSAIQVLTHEICHYRGRDHVFALLRLICCVVHWFNPLVWLGASLSRMDTELQCDDRVIAPLSANQKRDYASVLVLAAARRNAPGVGVLATGMTMTGRKLKTRISSIIGQGKRIRGLSVAFVVLASMALVGAFATAETTGLRLSLKPYPAIPAVSSLTSQPVSDKSSAIAQAQNVWRWTDKTLAADGFTWVYEQTAEALHQVTATSDEGELLLRMDDAGNVVYLRNNLSGLEQAVIVGYDIRMSTLNEGSDYEVKLPAYVHDCVYTLRPDMDGLIQDLGANLFSGEETAANGVHFHQYYWYMPDETVNAVTLEVYPQIRIVEYAENCEDNFGNG